MTTEDDLNKIRLEREKIAFEKECIELEKLKRSTASAENRNAALTRIAKVATSTETKSTAKILAIYVISFGLAGMGLLLTLSSFISFTEGYNSPLFSSIILGGGVWFFWQALRLFKVAESGQND